MSTDDVADEAWDKFRRSVRAVLAAEAPGPMPLFCEHDEYEGRDTNPERSYDLLWRRCRKCPASTVAIEDHQDPDGLRPHMIVKLAPLPMWLVGYTMPAAPNGTTMDVIDGGSA